MKYGSFIAPEPVISYILNIPLPNVNAVRIKGATTWLRCPKSKLQGTVGNYGGMFYKIEKSLLAEEQAEKLSKTTFY